MLQTAYADQNFLVYFFTHPEWKSAVLKAQKSDKLILILSPWHFYEFANGSNHPDFESIMALAEELKPMWAMTRANAQVFEFWAVWDQLWSGLNEPINIIGFFHDIAAILSRVDPKMLVNATIRSYVDAYAQDSALKDMRDSIALNREAAKANTKAYADGRFTKEIRREIDIGHISSTLARLTARTDDPKTVEVQRGNLLSDPLTNTKLRFFADMGMMIYLKCFITEGEFTEDLYKHGGILDDHRFVDREHATIALPYCNYFVTSDNKLINLCQRVKSVLPFQTAQVIEGAAFIELLHSMA